jgi:hypothetical protein
LKGISGWVLTGDFEEPVHDRVMIGEDQRLLLHKGIKAR